MNNYTYLPCGLAWVTSWNYKQGYWGPCLVELRCPCGVLVTSRKDFFLPALLSSLSSGSSFFSACKGLLYKALIEYGNDILLEDLLGRFSLLTRYVRKMHILIKSWSLHVLFEICLHTSIYWQWGVRTKCQPDKMPTGHNANQRLAFCPDLFLWLAFCPSQLFGWHFVRTITTCFGILSKSWKPPPLRGRGGLLTLCC